METVDFAGTASFATERADVSNVPAEVQAYVSLVKFRAAPVAGSQAVAEAVTIQEVA